MALRDPIAAIVIFAFSLTAFIMARDYGGGAELFPRGISAIMMVCSVLLFVRGIVRPTDGERMNGGELFRVGTVIVGTLLYMIGVDYLGFVTASFIYVPATAYFLGIRNHLLVWLSTLIFVSLVAFLFRSVFLVPLPRELILTFF